MQASKATTRTKWNFYDTFVTKKCISFWTFMNQNPLVQKQNLTEISGSSTWNALATVSKTSEPCLCLVLAVSRNTLIFSMWVGSVTSQITIPRTCQSPLWCLRTMLMGDFKRFSDSAEKEIWLCHNNQHNSPKWLPATNIQSAMPGEHCMTGSRLSRFPLSGLKRLNRARNLVEWLRTPSRADILASLQVRGIHSNTQWANNWEETEEGTRRFSKMLCVWEEKCYYF